MNGITLDVRKRDTMNIELSIPAIKRTGKSEFMDFICNTAPYLAEQNGMEITYIKGLMISSSTFSMTIRAQSPENDQVTLIVSTVVKQGFSKGYSSQVYVTGDFNTGQSIEEDHEVQKLPGFQETFFTNQISRKLVKRK